MGFEMWSLTLRGGCKLQVSENKEPVKVFVPKKDKAGEQLRLLYSEGHHDFFRKLSFVKIVKLKVTTI
jgi:hypothetical protein